MKRILCLICVLSLFLTGCSFSDKSSKLSTKCYDLGLNVLSVTDGYLNNKISAVVAAGQIQDLCRTLSALPDEAGTDDQNVKNYCEILGYTMMLIADGDHINEEGIIHTRNYLASLLGEDVIS